MSANDPEVAHTSTEPESIASVAFVPSDLGRAGPRVSLWQIVVTVLAVIAVVIFWFLFTSKSVQLRFTPAAADVEISGGPVFELGGVYLLREGSYGLKASAELHHDLDTTLEVGPDRNQSIEIAFTPLPGFLALTIAPHDAVVTVDGSAIGLGPDALELAAGQHEIGVTHPRYLPSAQIVDIEGLRKTQTLDVALAPNWSDVDVTSTPAGAAIYIDGEDSGVVTPGTIEALAGEREISVVLDGHKTHRERIFAQAGLGLMLDPIRLVQADAQLMVTSAPTGAGVTVNGRFMGQTPINVDLKSGTSHVVQVIRNGYATLERRVRIARGDSDALHANLVRQVGEVVFTALPGEATLFIDGAAKGSANQTMKLPIRPHDIEIVLDGHAGYKQTITPKVGLTQEVRVRLLTLAEARLKALVPTITSPGGQNLKLFDPFAFAMGASRREPGRRANETLREIEMTRLFYLGTQEVTNAEFKRFATGHDSGSFEDTPLNEDDMPVVSVSWTEAAAYCNWLSDQAGLPPFYQIQFGKIVGSNPQAIGYRLPTEAEWAWAARTQGDESGQPLLRFPWGRNLPPPERHGNYADRAASHLVGRIVFGYNDNYPVAAPVGTYKANTRGLFDMGGNVAEWINDFYAIDGGGASTDPTGPASGDYHVIRGSSWMQGTITELRYSFRDYGIDGRRDVGFRIARYAE